MSDEVPSAHRPLPDGAAGDAGSPPLAPSTAATSALPHPPPAIPDHELVRRIGARAYGEVWLARTALGAYRAVKVVYRSNFDGGRPYESEFEGIRKSEPVSRTHESQVDILHVGRGDGYFYYVMELADDANAERGTRNAELTLTHPAGTLSHPMGEGRDGAQAVPRTEFPAPTSCERVPSSALRVPSSYLPHTLKHDLKERGRLPPAECVEIGLALATALAHLHRHGLVHRDVKPSSIIFVGGVPKLADIGLVTDADTTFSYVGTEGYVAPEGPGSPQADLYSLGKVLYEISTGKDRKEYPALPPELRSLPDGDQLVELNAVILKACARQPRERYASADALRADLELLQHGKSVKQRRARQRRWAVATKAGMTGSALALLALFGYLLFIAMAHRTRTLPVGRADKASIFVLPFRHSAPIAERPVEYETEQTLCLCGRLTDAFIDALALLPGAKTGPRKSDWIRYDEDEVRQALVRTNDTRYILTGQADHTNDVLRLALRLCERQKDEPLWTETFAGTTDDVLALERRAITNLARRLALPISDNAQQQIDRTLSNNLAAYGWFIQGRAYHMTGAKIAYRQALDCFNRAVELDRNYVTAHVGYTRVQRELYPDRSPTEVWPVLARRAERILEIDDTCFVAQYRLANKLLAYDYAWERGIEAHDRLITIWRERNLSWVVYYRTLGRTNEARVFHERLKQEPEVDLHELQHLAFGEAVWQNYDEAIRIARRSVELAPDLPAFGPYNLGRCLLMAGRYPEAIDALLKALRDWEGPEMYGLLGRAYALMGDRTKALEMLSRLEERERADEADPYFLAWIHAALGSKDQALALLDKAIDYRSEYITSPDFGGQRTDPAWDGLREDPRFEDICRRVGMGHGQWPK